MNDALLEVAALEASLGVKGKDGGPFGAVITDKKGNIICKAHNMVLSTHDVTAHAEVMAIREACRILDTHDLSDYVLYSSCEPCPMCLSAIIWSNIKDIYYSTDRVEVGNIGFRDDLIYNYLEGKCRDIIKVTRIENKECQDLLNNYKNTIY